MLNKFEEVLEKWNGGFRGAKIKLARELKVDDSTISAWLKGRSKPGKDKIIKMAKLFKKSEEEIKSMFVVDNSVNQQANGNSGNVISGNSFSNVGNVAASHGGDIEGIRQELRETRGSLGDKIKVLEAKLDLILEKLRKGK